MNGLLTHEFFAPHLGKSFAISGTGFVLRLSAATTMDAASAPGAGRVPFTLVFETPRGSTHLPEGLYNCAVADGPALSIYISPIHTPAADRQDYQAVFN